MANALNRDLMTNDKVVMKGGESVEIASDATFGAMSFTTGTALFIKRFGSTEELRCSGFDIDAAETMRRHAKENGWID